MTVTNDMVVRLRRMIAEPTEAVYTDDELKSLIGSTAIRDKYGYEPTEASWTATYDLYLVASEIWLEKAADVQNEFDFNADGGDFKRSQKYLQAIKQSGIYKSRSKAHSMHLRQYPRTSLSSSFGYEDLEYKDWIDDFESELE